MWGSWYTSWRREEMGEGAERAEKMTSEGCDGEERG